MSPKTNKQSKDPFVFVIEQLFKAVWWLVSYPFRDKNRQAVAARRKTELQAHWRLVEQLMAEGQWREAIMKADIVLGEALALAGFGGHNVGERLKAATSLGRPLLDAAWRAHKVRNRLAHELTFQPTSAEAKAAIDNFRSVIRQLGV